MGGIAAEEAERTESEIPLVFLLSLTTAETRSFLLFILPFSYPVHPVPFNSILCHLDLTRLVFYCYCCCCCCCSFRAFQYNHFTTWIRFLSLSVYTSPCLNLLHVLGHWNLLNPGVSCGGVYGVTWPAERWSKRQDVAMHRASCVVIVQFRWRRWK